MPELTCPKCGCESYCIERIGEARKRVISCYRCGEVIYGS